jgi:hypothetical protein
LPGNSQFRVKFIIPPEKNLIFEQTLGSAAHDMSSGATSITEKPFDSGANSHTTESGLEANLPTNTGVEPPETDPNASPRKIHGIVVSKNLTGRRVVGIEADLDGHL